MPTARSLGGRLSLPLFQTPAASVALPAGVLQFGTSLSDPVPDAEIRVMPQPVDPGRAAAILMPPTEVVAGVGQRADADIDLASKIAERGGSLSWIDLGLPRTTVSRERFLLDLMEDPIAIQLEWPRGDAIDLFHRLERATRRPSWIFHRSRQLGDVRGSVLIKDAIGIRDVDSSTEITVGDVVAPLIEFERAEPSILPAPPPLAREVIYRWRRVPQLAPQGAQPAAIIHQWKAVDEWAARRVDQNREALRRLSGEEPDLLARLRRWLPNRDSAQQERRRLAEEIEELGECPPSDDPSSAADRVRRLAAILSRTREIIATSHADRQEAEDKAVEEAERAAWTSRRDAAATELASVRARIEETSGEGPRGKRSLTGR